MSLICQLLLSRLVGYMLQRLYSSGKVPNGLLCEIEQKKHEKFPNICESGLDLDVKNYAKISRPIYAFHDF